MAPERLSSGPLDLSSSLEDDKDSLEEHRVWEDVNPLVARGERERGRGEPASEEEVRDAGAGRNRGRDHGIEGRREDRGVES